MATKNIKPKKERVVKKTGYHPKGDEKIVFEKFTNRKAALLDSRRSVDGVDIDQQMRKWDTDYFNRKADIPASELDADYKPIAINNAFGKVQSALGILIDRNPEITLEEKSRQYSANRELMKSLAMTSWQKTNSIGQLKLFVFNMAKRGWAVGRTYYRHLKHDARFLEKIEADGKRVYTQQEIVKVNDVAFVNLNNHNVWLDEQTVPEDFYSTRDWMWREVMHIDDLLELFPESEYPNIKLVKAGGNTEEVIERGGSSTEGNEAKAQKEGMTEVFFYENWVDDWFIVEINGVMVVWEPLPQNHKRLSCTYGYWYLRNAESIYGIGIVEAMEKEESIIDRILNLDLRQLIMTISPPGFYTGSQDYEDEDLKYMAGVLRRVLDPENIKFLEVPQGNQRGLEKIEWLENKEDSRTGITKTLEGEIQEKGTTAFETGVNRESGLKRLKLPLKSIQYALEWEFMNRIDLIKQVYSDFDVNQVADPEDIQNYLDEVNADPAYYFIDNEGVPGKEVFYKKEYREVHLNLEQDDSGNFMPAENRSFFNIKPEMLSFEGDVIVDAQSILVTSEEVEKANTLQVANMLFPLIAEGQPELIGRPVVQLLQAFNRDPKKWLPDSWLEALNQTGKLGDSEEQAEEIEGNELEEAGLPRELSGLEMEAETVVPESEVDGGRIGLGQRLSNAYQGFMGRE